MAVDQRTMRVLPLLLMGLAFVVVVLEAAGWLGGRDRSGPRPASDPDQLRASLRTREAADRPALVARYPFGYALFAVAGTELYRLDGPAVRGRAPAVDWGRTELLSNVRTAVVLRPPDVTADDGRVLAASAVRMPRIAGFARSYLRGAGIEGVAEVVHADWTGFTCVLGLRPEPDGRRG